MIWEPFGNQIAILWPDGAREAAGSRKLFFCERARNSCEHPPFRCRVVNLDRSNTVTTHTHKMSVNFRSGARCTLYRPLIHRQDPYRINLFGEYIQVARVPWLMHKENTLKKGVYTYVYIVVPYCFRSLNFKTSQRLLKAKF